MNFDIATPDDIRSGRVADIYFKRVRTVLQQKGRDAHVHGEVRAAALPDGWRWAILAGLDEVVALLEGLPVTVRAMPEGTPFHAGEPVLTVEGRYTDFGVYETALLGLLCQASGVATMAARCKIAAGQRPVYSFGARRMHPAIAPMIERNAYLAGCDGVAVELSAEMLHHPPVGTMAHAFILVMGDECEAFAAFDEVLDPEIPRIALVDTFQDEKFGALAAARCLGERLAGIRLDTPSSRRGDFRRIIDEVRWELDLAGFRDVKIIVSGGLDEHAILALGPNADSFGVGTSISNAPVVDFSFDLVEVDGRPCAKRGKESGRKQVYRCEACGRRAVVPLDEIEPRCDCGPGSMLPLLDTLIVKGALTAALPDPDDTRRRLLPHLLDGSLAL